MNLCMYSICFYYYSVFGALMNSERKIFVFSVPLYSKAPIIDG